MDFDAVFQDIAESSLKDVSEDQQIEPIDTVLAVTAMGEAVLVLSRLMERQLEPEPILASPVFVEQVRALRELAIKVSDAVMEYFDEDSPCTCEDCEECSIEDEENEDDEPFS